MEPAALAYLVAFSAVYIVTVGVVFGFAFEWRRKMKKAEKDSWTRSVRRLVRLNRASADVSDALAYQKRTNEAARARIRRAERQARDNARQADLNAEMLRESRGANARLAAEYVAGTSVLGQHADNISRAAERARRHSFSRAKENTRLLRELERDIDEMVSGKVTPEDMERRLGTLEAQIRDQRRDNQRADGLFYQKVGELMAASEETQRGIRDEIAALYATGEEVGYQFGELKSDIDEARAALGKQYEGILEASKRIADEWNSLSTGGGLDGAKLDALRSSYDEVISDVKSYTKLVEENDAEWGRLDKRLLAVERISSDDLERQNKDVLEALDDLKRFIGSNCASGGPADSDVAAASKKADDLVKVLEETRSECAGGAE